MNDLALALLTGGIGLVGVLVGALFGYLGVRLQDRRAVASARFDRREIGRLRREADLEAVIATSTKIRIADTRWHAQERDETEDEKIRAEIIDLASHLDDRSAVLGDPALRALVKELYGRLAAGPVSAGGPTTPMHPRMWEDLGGEAVTRKELAERVSERAGELFRDIQAEREAD